MKNMHTPEQNGESERENRIIVEMTRTLKNSNHDLKFLQWAELVNTSAYILNRTEKSSIKNVSPYELCTGKKHGINHETLGLCVMPTFPNKNEEKRMNKLLKLI